jgi:2-(1,2-epoxy-1,2-dihydrophenyl)acetyl-CoA isomerase
MKHEHLVYTKEDGIATLRLNRPQELNAFTWDMYESLIDIIDEAAVDDEVRVLIVTGTGRAFCVGADVRSLEQGFEDKSKLVAGASGRAASRSKKSAGRKKRRASSHITVQLQKMNKPVIAAVNGIAAGGGLDAACACDIRIASEKATFSSVFVRRGIVPTMGGTYFLPRLIGIDRACEMIWTGDLVDAKEALRIGLVTRVVPDDELMAATEELAVKLATGPPLAIARAKGMMYRGLEIELERAMEEIMDAWVTLSRTEDHREALAAFLEKREPVFRGK